MPPDAITGGTAGAVTICLLVWGALKAGWLATGQHVASMKESAAQHRASIEKHCASEVAIMGQLVESQRERAVRAEKHVDAALQNNGQIVTAMIEIVKKPTA